MTNIITKENNSVLADLQNTRQLCQLLMETPHYAKIGKEGIYAIVETAKSLNIDPRLALGGGLYYVKGKVELSARMMNSLIRSQKHSITRDKKSDDTICVLHGKRADNGDTWTESFSLEDAKKAGLANNPVWKNFTRDMLFARALSRLARQLFPDIIGNCYVEGELSLDPNIMPTLNVAVEPVKEVSIPKELPAPEVSEGITLEEADALGDLIGDDIDYRQCVLKFLEKNCKVNSFAQMPRQIYDKVYAKALKNKEEREKTLDFTQPWGEMNQMSVGGG